MTNEAYRVNKTTIETDGIVNVYYLIECSSTLSPTTRGELMILHSDKHILEKNASILLITDDGWVNREYKNVPNFYRLYENPLCENLQDGEIIVEISSDENIRLNDVYQLVVDDCELLRDRNYKKILLFEKKNWEEFSFSTQLINFQQDGKTKHICCKTIINDSYLSSQPPNILTQLEDKIENFLTDIIKEKEKEKEKEDHLKFLKNFIPLVEKVIEKVIENNPEDAQLLQEYVDSAKQELTKSGKNKYEN